MRILRYNWRLAWVAVPAFLWAWIGMSLAVGGEIAAGQPGDPPLRISFARGKQGLHVPGILRGIVESDEGLLIRLELPSGAREKLRAKGLLDDQGQPKEGLFPQLDELLGQPGPPAELRSDTPLGDGRRGKDGQFPAPVIPKLPKLPDGVRIEILEPGESERGRPDIELLDPKPPIDLPHGDKLFITRDFLLRVGPDGLRLLPRPQGGGEALRGLIRKLRREDEHGPGGGGQLGPGQQRREQRRDDRRDLRQERRDQRGERRDERRGQPMPGGGQGQPPGKGKGQPPKDGQGHPPKGGQGRPPAEGQGRPPGGGQGQPPGGGQGQPPAGGKGQPPAPGR